MTDIRYLRPTGSLELTREEHRAYDRDGFLVRKGVFKAPEVKAFREAAERAAVKAAGLAAAGRTYLLDGNRFVDNGFVTVQFEHSPHSRNIRVIEPVQQLDALFENLVDDARIVEPMRGLIGCGRVALWTAKLNLKPAGVGSGFPWHQDSPYWIHDCDHVDRLPNVLVAFDDASEANGCLRIIRGSHRKGRLPGKNDGTQLGGLFTAMDWFDAAQQMAMEVPAGSLVFFSPHAVHGSMPNTSSHPRRALVLTYQPADYPMLKSKEIRNAGD